MLARYSFGNTMKVAALALALTLAMSTTGCKSAADKANDAAIAQAKQQAAATNSPQQVTWNDKDGNTVTTLVQPPAPGQTTQQLTTTKTTHATSGGTVTNSTSTSTTMSPVVGPAPVQPIVAPAGGTAMDQGVASIAASGPSAPVITPVDVHVPRGTTLAIRINQHISVKTSRAGDRFTGELAHDVLAGDSNRVAIPRGTHVNGVVDASHRRGHFKGRSILELRLTSLEMGGQRYELDTHDNVRTKKGKGKRSTAFIGGGTGLGMLVGGVATGGVGLVVGGLVGAGGGTLLGGLTGNRDIEIPAESVMNFKLADDLVVQPLQ